MRPPCSVGDCSAGLERGLFAGLLNFSSAYRVAGPFSSMRVGGGHIGAYAALALPFVLTLVPLRRRWMAMGLVAISCLLGGYTITATFARTGYAACAVALVVSGMAWSCGNRRRQLGLLPAGVLLLALAAAATFSDMQGRFAASAQDLQTRYDNWAAGMAARDRDVTTTLFGMGLGTYQRAMLTRSPINRPSDLVLAQAGGIRFVSMRLETPFFLGQKISLPDHGDLHLTMRARLPDGQGELGLLICDKVLLYSDQCRGPANALRVSDQWTDVTATFASGGLGAGTLLGLLRRPVEFSVSGSIGHRLDIGDIRLTDDAGGAMLVNGDFAHGLDRWIFTDDSHVSWRMLNQYLMLFFETGLFGLGAFCALAGLAMAGGVRAMRDGDMAGAAVIGAVAGFLVSCLFDNLLEAPRLASLFVLVCLCGVVQWEAGSAPQ